MSDIQVIKDRIRKLMNVAGNGAATEGEIDNAMRLAAKLLDAHHLSESDIPTDQDAQDMTMGKSVGVSGTSRFSTWENVLGAAIVELFGCVNWYIGHRKAPIRVDGVAATDEEGNVKRGVEIHFYGPMIEAAEAADLFQEWSRSIAAMGVARWGGCFRGDGAKYCLGFAQAVYRKANSINKERKQIHAKPMPLLPGKTETTAITLADRYLTIKEAGRDWLKNEKKISLSSGGSRTGYSAGSDEAYQEGKLHGSKANFGRSTKRKHLPGK